MPSLDGWRGLAILVVVFHNAGFVLAPDSTPVVALARTAFAAGWVGVSLFFVLSGFLITGILLDDVGAPGFFRRFYVRRTLRIFPLYYGFLAVALVLMPRILPPSDWTAAVRADQAWYWLYLSNWGPLMEGGIPGLPHLWSLAVEEQFYLIWPLLLFAAGRHFPAVVMVAIAAAPLSRWVMHSMESDPQYLYQFTIARIDPLALGALAAVLVRRPEWHEAFWRTRWALSGLLLVGLGGIFLGTGGFGPLNPTVLVYGQTLVACLFAVGMLVALEPRTAIERAATQAISAAWLRFLGKYSYAIYLFHVPIHTALGPYASPLVNAGGGTAKVGGAIAYSGVVLLASTALAYLSWHGFEKHFLALRERLPVARRRASPV